ncbi:MAG: 1-acyl-sn-glycerol-3-phosphate acyltransferase [Leptospiraceae bacterium]
MSEEINQHIPATFDHYTVMGGGPMGLMLAAILAKNVERVLLWLPESSMAHQWSGRKHIRLLNLDFEIPSNVRIVSGYRLFQQGSHFIASVVPARQFEEVHEHVVTHMNRTNQHAIITFSKGFLSSVGRRKYQVATFSEFLARAMEAYQLQSHVAVATGPSLLADLHAGRHCFFAVGSKEPEMQTLVEKLFEAPHLHWERSKDMVGVELGGILKNPVAIISGMADFLPDAGSSFKGELVGKGFNEIMRLGTALGARPETLMGRSGLSDLAANAFSPDSRNRSYGRRFMERIQSGEIEPDFLERIELLLFPGRFIEREVHQSRELHEGGLTISTVLDIAKEKSVELPLFQTLFDILSRRQSPNAFVDQLTGLNTNTAIPVTKKRARLDLITSGKALGQALQERILREISSTRGMQARIKKQSGHVISSLEKRVQKAERRRLKNDAANFRKELELWRGLAASPEESETIHLDRIVEFYVSNIADSYVPVIRGTLMNIIAPFRFVLGGFQRGSVAPVIGGPVAEVRRLANYYPVFYAPTHKTHIDSVELAYALYLSRLPLPRFAAASILMSNPLWGKFLKSMGAYSVDRENTRNILYLETLTQYSILMLEAGIPALAYPEGTRSRNGNFQGIKTGLLSTAVDAFRSSGQEIIVVPMAISHKWIPEDLEFNNLTPNTSFMRFVRRRRKVYLDFGRPILISNHIKSSDPTAAVSDAILSSWRRNFRVQPHFILARLLTENEGSLDLKEAEKQIAQFIQKNRLNYSTTDPGKILRRGRKDLRSRKLIRDDRNKILSVQPDMLAYYGRMIPEAEKNS